METSPRWLAMRRHTSLHAPVAQRTERLPSKQRVAGSIPAWGTISLFRSYGETITVNRAFTPLTTPLHQTINVQIP